MSEYRNHNPMDVLKSPHYAKHVGAMTSEELHSKADIAEELAHRDMEIERLRAEVERLSKELRYQDYRDGRIGTHSHTCYTFGHRHYECALQRIAALEAALKVARDALIACDVLFAPLAKDSTQANAIDSAREAIATIDEAMKCP